MEALNKLQEKMVMEAIKHINTDDVVKKLTKKLEDSIINGFDENLQNIDISYWIREELEDDSTKAGKAFSKAISNMAENMAKAVNKK